MSRVIQSLLAVVVVAASVSAAQAAPLFLGSPFFSIAPYTQMGSMYEYLTPYTLSNGFMVAGQAQITVPAGAVSGTLLRYQVKQQLNPTYGTNALYLTHFIVGYSQPPSSGTFGATSGYCKTYFEFSGGPNNTPLTLVNGAAIWNTNQSGPSFTYTSGIDVYMVQDFELDGSQLSGPGGVWTVDLPVESYALPEPTSVALLGAGLLMMCRRRRARRS